MQLSACPRCTFNTEWIAFAIKSISACACKYIRNLDLSHHITKNLRGLKNKGLIATFHVSARTYGGQAQCLFMERYAFQPTSPDRIDPPPFPRDNLIDSMESTLAEIYKDKAVIDSLLPHASTLATSQNVDWEFFTDGAFYPRSPCPHLYNNGSGIVAID